LSITTTGSEAITRASGAKCQILSIALNNHIRIVYLNNIGIVNKKLKKEGEINSIKRTVTPNSRYAADGLSVIAILDNSCIYW
jgi:hypothetical protein